MLSGGDEVVVCECDEIVCVIDLHSHECDMQAVGPVALVSLLLNNGLTKLMPAAEMNTNPNHPSDPAVQMQYNHAAIQVLPLACSSVPVMRCAVLCLC